MFTSVQPPRPWRPLLGRAPAILVGLGIVVLALGVSPGDAAAQVVRGEIRDAETRQPVPGARVAVRSEAGTVLTEANAGAAGEFTLLGLPEGPLTLEVSAPGYAASAGTAVDHRGKSLFLTIDMDPAALQGAEIRVTVERQNSYLADRGYYLRQRKGHGHFLTPSKMSLLRPSDMFRRVAGIDVVGGEPVIGRGPASFRRCRPAVYQDGLLVRSELSSRPFNDVVAPSAYIQAVEVYPGPASAPVQWRGSASCGLIVVWTDL